MHGQLGLEGSYASLPIPGKRRGGATIPGGLGILGNVKINRERFSEGRIKDAGERERGKCTGI